MRQVIKFISDDGREFLDEAAFISYESLCEKVAAIMSKLPAVPDLPGCGFANGDGYLQHDPKTAMEARNALLQLANEIMPHAWFRQALGDPSIHPSWPGRMIGEMSERCLSKAWDRFMCMTSDFREFGQPYFASHPQEAKGVCLNGSAA